MFAAIRRASLRVRSLVAELQRGFSSVRWRPRRAFTQCSAGLNELGQLATIGQRPRLDWIAPRGVINEATAAWSNAF